jgi:hypothetical protein
MDKNKLDKLREINYTVKKCCGNCTFSYIKTDKLFGVCKKYNYDHLKHCGESRQLSVNRYGFCLCHVVNEKFVNEIHAYKILCTGQKFITY